MWKDVSLRSIWSNLNEPQRLIEGFAVVGSESAGRASRGRIQRGEEGLVCADEDNGTSSISSLFILKTLPSCFHQSLKRGRLSLDEHNTLVRPVSLISLSTAHHIVRLHCTGDLPENRTFPIQVRRRRQGNEKLLDTGPCWNERGSRQTRPRICHQR